MKRWLNVAVSFYCVIASSLGFSLTASDYYVGLHYVQRELKMVSGFGRGQFAKRLPHAELVAGVSFADHWDIELGTLLGDKATRTTLSTAGEQLLGIPLTMLHGDSFFVSQGMVALQAVRLKLNKRFPLYQDLEGLLSIGLGREWLRATYQFSAVAGFGNPILFKNPLRYHFVAYQWIPSVAVGLAYRLSPHIQIKIIGGVELTRRFKNINSHRQDNVTNPLPFQISLKNNPLLSVGLQWCF